MKKDKEKEGERRSKTIFEISERDRKREQKREGDTKIQREERRETVSQTEREAYNREW